MEPDLNHPNRVLAVGEVLWDVFADCHRLGGAPLNFGAHARRMQHETLVISALGEDELGRSARAALGTLGLDTRFVQSTTQLPTGTASVQLGPEGHAVGPVPVRSRARAGGHGGVLVAERAGRDDVRGTDHRAVQW